MRCARLSGMVGTALTAIVALAALPAGAETPSFGGVAAAQAPGCVPVPAAECGSVRVPLFRSKPAGPKIDVAYVLVHHRDPALPSARGTVAFNPGGPGEAVINNAAMWRETFADLLDDHDLLLIDPRGTGRSHPVRCGLTSTSIPATRKGFVRAIGICGKRLGRQARAYTSAATADDFEAVRAHLGIPKLDLYGVSSGTYLMTVFAQRHTDAVRSIVLSSAFPLGFDMWGRANAQAVRMAVRRVCARSATGTCDGARTLRQLGRLARRVRAHPDPLPPARRATPARRDRPRRHRLPGRDRRPDQPAPGGRAGGPQGRYSAADRRCPCGGAVVQRVASSPRGSARSGR